MIAIVRFLRYLHDGCHCRQAGMKFQANSLGSLKKGLTAQVA